MRWMFLSLLVVVGLLSSRSEASCISPAEQCFCVGASRSGIAFTSSIEPFTATVTVESGANGYAADQTVTVSSEKGDELNKKWVVFETDAGVRRLPIDAKGQVGCASQAYPGVVMPASGLVGAWQHGTCDQTTLVAHGYADPPCNDTGRGCSATPGSLAGLALLLALRRRTRVGKPSP